jgi:excisionase family DNA binding protein
MTVPEAARRVGRDPETVRRWIRSGKLRSQNIGTQHLIDERDLQAFDKGNDSLPMPDMWRTFPDGHSPAELGKDRPAIARQSLTLVLDTSVDVRSCGDPDGFSPFDGHSLVAPPVMWSEFLSVVHEAVWRREIGGERATEIRARLGEAPVEPSSPPDLHEHAWRVADELGWAKTYHAEYVALARIFRCRLVTLDARLQRGAGRLGFVVGPTEI